MVPWKYAPLMSKSFTANDKLADIMTETSTLLVESADSSMSATRLCLALKQSHKHHLNVLHHFLPVPQSNAISLIPASSISSVSSSAWGTGYATSLCTKPGSRSTPDLQENIHHCHSQNPPRSFKNGSQSSEVSGTEPIISPAVFI